MIYWYLLESISQSLRQITLVKIEILMLEAELVAVSGLSLTPDPERFVLGITGRNILKVEKILLSTARFLHLPATSLANALSDPLASYSLVKKIFRLRWLPAGSTGFFKRNSCSLVSFQPRTVENGNTVSLSSGRHGCNFWGPRATPGFVSWCSFLLTMQCVESPSLLPMFAGCL